MLGRLRNWLLAILAVTGTYLYGFPTPNLPYGATILAHVALGVLLTGLLVPPALRAFREHAGSGRVGWMLVAAGAVAGMVLVWTGTTRPFRPLLYTHIALTVVGLALILAGAFRRRGPLVTSPAVARHAVALLLVAAVGAFTWYTRTVRWEQAYRIENPSMPPATMEAEGLGRSGPFFPSSLRTPDGGTIKPSFFMDSQACQRCHSDVYDQWFSSAHHFSSFNNQWYRKSIEYMQEVNGIEPSKWCGGCHDPAVLIGGLMDTPIKEIIDRPESQAGLGCVACHAVVDVNSSMGQGHYTMEYPTLSDLAASEEPMMRFLHDFLVKVNPEPHRRAFLKPFMRNGQSPEFCSTCHKVHLDVPVNNYRWIRGFNDYDNWQASGVSGMGARSFYYPPEPQRCVDCHMPAVESDDFGNKGGLIKSHRFAAANSALPVANKDQAQLDAVEAFLKESVTVDIFALGPALEKTGGAMLPSGELATTFAVGEEASLEVSPAVHDGEPARPVTAPLDRVTGKVRRGDTVRVDVVVRTRRVGHFFPGGTVDAFDVWVELQALDDNGRVIYWSGMVEDEGRGPVEPGAHFYRSRQIDAQGNPINKRNAWAARAVVYVKLIPPGAADTVHYRLQIPESVGDRITLKAKLNYRKFEHYNTQFAYAGVPDPEYADASFDKHHDNREFVFTGDTSGVSGKVKEIPNLPIIVMSSDQATLEVLPKGAPEPPWQTALANEDWTRWNDYGIGLLLQGDLKHAEQAFMKVTEIAPENPDGWVNIGRVRVQEGNVAGAREVLEKALSLSPDLARANYFFARVLKSEGKLEEAVDTLRKVAAQYPKDRVVRNDIGRNLFLLRRYDEAVQEFEETLRIDPEDLTAHYNLMLSYNGLGNEERAKAHEARYLRFKADEASQAITGPYRLKNPEDNNERQAIHEHVSVDLTQVGLESRAN